MQLNIMHKLLLSVGHKRQTPLISDYAPLSSFLRLLCTLRLRAPSPSQAQPQTSSSSRSPQQEDIRPHITNMADRELQEVLRKLKHSKDYSTSSALLSRAKILLLKLNALTPTPKTPKTILLHAREVFETGALISIRHKDADAFTRYVNQLQPFYDLPAEVLPGDRSERAKITGLYLLLLLMKGDYAGFHTELEGLELRTGFDGNGKGGDVEGDKYLSYPVKLERWLMEGSYDRVWKAMASREVPSEEYGVFSEVCTCSLLLLPLLYSLVSKCPNGSTTDLDPSDPRRDSFMQ
jgi:CSN8/PSMD8/EIF3K family